MTANQLPIFGKGNVTFHNACAHTRCCTVGFFSVFRELQRCAAVADGKVASSLRAALRGAGLQGLFGWPAIHIRDKVIGARAERNRVRAAIFVILAGTRHGCHADSQGGDASFPGPYPFHDQPPALRWRLGL